METVHRVGGTIRKSGIVLERPAALLEAWNCVSDRDQVVELLQRTINQGTVRPRTAVGNVEVIAPGLCLETRRAVRRDAVAVSALGATEFAAAANLLGKLFTTPYAFDQNSHLCPSTTAATRRSSDLAQTPL